MENNEEGFLLKKLKLTKQVLSGKQIARFWAKVNKIRVLKNEYGRKAKCFMEKGNKKCKEKEWKKVIKPDAHERRTI